MDNDFPAWNSMPVPLPENRAVSCAQRCELSIGSWVGYPCTDACQLIPIHRPRRTRREIEFEPGLTLGQLVAILRGFVAQHPNPDEDGRPVTAKVRSNGQLIKLEIWER